jgi:hypothetical protein
MKFLEPVEQSAIPSPQTTDGKISKYQELYDRVLSLNGKALPIEFEDAKSADKQASNWKQKHSACRKQGIRAVLRGKVIYLSKRS